MSKTAGQLGSEWGAWSGRRKIHFAGGRVGNGKRETNAPRGVGRTGLSSELAVCIWYPLFALCCELQRHPECVARPIALLAAEDGRRLWQVAPSARREGVKPGMTVSQAVGLCPSLSLWEPDPVYYDQQFSNLLLALGDVSPVIEPAELGRVYVGVDGLEKLYGPPEKQVETIRQMIAVWQEGLGARGGERRGDRETGSGKPQAYLAKSHERTEQSAHLHICTSARLGWGRGKFTAWVAATRAKPGEAVIISDEERAEFTASQPVGVLQIDQDTHRRLWQLGIKTLSDLARLPEVAIVSQFGRMGRQLWSLATGRIVDPVVGRETPEPIVVAIDFPNPVADRTMLAHALDRLIERALHHPQRTGWRILEVQARAQLENGASWMIGVTLKDPSANRDHIAAPLKVRMEQAPPAKAVETLAVEFTLFARGTDELQLFARDATSSARAGRQHALRTAVREIRTRYRYSGLYQVVEVQPRSRLLGRRYALIDYDP